MADNRAASAEEHGEGAFRDESAKFNLSSKFFQGPPKHSLAFVNLTTSSGAIQDPNKRRLVRSHVMYNVHQQRYEEEERLFHHWDEAKSIVPHVVPVQDHGEPETDLTRDEDLKQVGFTGAGTWVLNAYEDNPTPQPGIYHDDNTSNQPRSLDYHEGLQHADSHLEEQSAEAASTQRSQSLTPIQSIRLNPMSSRNVDPFNSLPSIQNGNVQALIYHYTKVLVRSMLSVAVDPEDKWFSYSASDPGIFHSTMLHSAAHNAMLSGRNDFGDPNLIKWNAVRIVNERLQDPVLSISDLTMGAVVALALFENQAANVEISTLHIDGLYKMVQLRGGLQNLGLAGILKRKIFWADLCNSWLSQRKPRFEYFVSPYSSPREEQMPEMDVSTSQSDVWNKQLAQILASLRSMSLALSGPFSRTNVDVDDIYRLERLIVVLLAETNLSSQTPDLQVEAKSQLAIYQTSLAALSYLYLFFRDNLVRAPLFSVLVSRLSESLYAGSTATQTGAVDTLSRLSDGKSENDELRFWVVVVGALISTGRTERGLFVADLRKLGEQMRMYTFEQYLQILKQTAWIDSREDGFLWLLWSEVQANNRNSS